MEEFSARMEPGYGGSQNTLLSTRLAHFNAYLSIKQRDLYYNCRPRQSYTEQLHLTPEPQKPPTPSLQQLESDPSSQASSVACENVHAARTRIETIYSNCISGTIWKSRKAVGCCGCVSSTDPYDRRNFFKLDIDDLCDACRGQATTISNK